MTTPATRISTITRAQQLLRWATVPEQSGPKTGGGAAVPLSMGAAGSPSNTMCAWPRPTLVPSDILIHPAVWSQETLAEKWKGLLCPFLRGELTQYGLGRGLPPVNSASSGILIRPTVWLQYSDSIGRTVLQTVAQKVISPK